MTWLLGNMGRGGDPDGDGFIHTVTGPNGKTISLNSWVLENLGRCNFLGGLAEHTSLNLTSTPGAVSAVYYSLVFQLGRMDFKVYKVDEAIEVSPVHAQYYQLTMKQKEELEARIKAGLASAAQAVSDYELLKHDERKYLEFKHYFEAKDEHALRAVFIDQVDVHTGEGISMRSIVARWPTLIADFMKLKDDDTDPDKVKDRLKISKAEAIVLVTKNKLYKEWKGIFLSEVDSRLDRIQSLIASRQKSIDEYREWLKPYITRFKLIKQAFEQPASRKAAVSDFVAAGGHAVSSAQVVVWAWKDVQPSEIRRPAPELAALKPIDPYDDFTKRELIWNKYYGLVTDYPWMTKEWVDKKMNEIKNIDKWMAADRYYYTLLEITFDRCNIRLASGGEIEDGVFKVNELWMSQNALLAKLLELKAKQEEMERYVDELLGLKPKPEAGKPLELKKKEEYKAPWGLRFFKPKSYESDFDDRIPEYHLSNAAKACYIPVVAYLKNEFKFGR